MKAVGLITETEYWRDYEITQNEVYTAIASFYTYIEIHNFAAENNASYQKINQAAEFWNIQLYGLQTAFFATLGRLFDRRADSHSIDKLLAATEAHPEFFTKAALAGRRTSGGQKPEWLDEFLLDVWEPSAADVASLSAALTPCTTKFKSVYGPIRHKVFAHRGLKTKTQTDALFSKTQIKEIDDLLYALHDLLEAIWQLYHNGMKPDLGKRTYDYRERIATTTRNVLGSL